MKAYSLNPCAPEEESVNFIDNWKELGIGDRKLSQPQLHSSQPQLHLRFEANLDYRRPSEKYFRGGLIISN